MKRPALAAGPRVALTLLLAACARRLASPAASAAPADFVRPGAGAAASAPVKDEGVPPVSPAEAPGTCPPEMAPVEGNGVRACVDVWESALSVDGAHWSFARSVDKVDPAKLRAVPGRGVKPQVNVSALQAAAACRGAGKRLCSLAEWTLACRGPNDDLFPYGPQYKLGACNEGRPSPVADVQRTVRKGETLRLTDARLALHEHTIARGGAHPRCVSAFGIFDLHGNVHEWIADVPHPEARHLGTFMGGFFADARMNGDGCTYKTTAHSKEYHDYSTGFRCCRDLNPAPPP